MTYWRLFSFSLSLLFSVPGYAQVVFLECPEGTKKKSVLEENEIHEWCADKDGVRQGGYSLRSGEGVPKVFVEYKDDERHGQYVRYHANGKPAEQGFIEKGKPTGEWKRFHSSGALSDIGKWEDGAPNGLWKLYHDNGKLEAEGLFDDGDRVGVWKFYDREGQLSSEKNYEETNVFVEAGYFGVYDSQGESHSGTIGFNYFPFQSTWADGLSLSMRYGTIVPNDEGESVDDIELLAVTLGYYWRFGGLWVGLNFGSAEILNSDEENSENEKYVGIDTYIETNQSWIKRYGFSFHHLDNSLTALTFKAVLWEF